MLNHQYEAALAFRALHEQSDLFVMPCAWDAFSAMLFEQVGFQCIGTTSGGVNWVNGRKDYVYSVPRELMIDAYQKIVASTSLPVSADLENGYGPHSDDVAETIRASIVAGCVGGSIEDQRVVPDNSDFNNGELYDLDVAVERIAAARQVADAADFPYVLTARCEVFYTNAENKYAEAVRRLNAYRQAGADCLFVPGLNHLASLEQLVRDVDGPISFGMGATPVPITLDMLRDIGIRRVSTGGGMARATFGLLNRAVYGILQKGEFNYLNDALSESEVDSVLQTVEMGR